MSVSRMRVPPPSAGSAVTVPPCASATWRTIASPRPEPGMPRAAGRAVEAVEDERQVLRRRSPGRGRGRSPRRRARSLRPRRRAGSTWRRCRAGSRSRARSSTGTPRISDSSSSGSNVTPGRLRRVRSIASAVDEVEPHVLRLRRRLVAARELDELRDQRRHLGQLLGHVPQQLLALAGRQRLVAGEHLDVRAQARQRRPQLVRGVGDELPLRPCGVLERAEHRVEGRGEPRELVRCRRRRSAARGRASPRPPRPSASAAAPARAPRARRAGRGRRRARSRRAAMSDQERADPTEDARRPPRATAPTWTA